MPHDLSDRRHAYAHRHQQAQHEELPRPEADDAQRGLKNIEAHHAKGRKIDYVLTHTCPERLIKPMFHVNPIGDETCRWLTMVEGMVENEMVGWYFGHWHEDIDRWKYHCLYDRVLRLI